ncbi:MAG: HlyD family secretion protein [Acidobacteriota bacterium]|nr:HlyD family secretion protein [Acidobacteriota bacterium]
MSEQTTQTAPETANGADTAEKSSNRKSIVLGVIVVIALLAGLFYWRSTFTEDTDDAQVDGNLYQVSARVAGQVTKVYVNDNQTVHAGDLLAEIDPRDYQVALEQAQAVLAQAQAAYEQAEVNVPLTAVNVHTNISTSQSDVQGSSAGVVQAQKQLLTAEARVDEAKANAVKAQADVDRYTPLVQKDVISKQQFDAAVAQAAAAKANVVAAESQVLAAQEAVRQAQQRSSQARDQALQASKNASGQVRAQQAAAQAALANVKQAQARVDQAQLNVSYTRITAPVDGIVNKKSVEVGTNLGVGQDLLTIVPLTNLWVTANFKETQIEHMKPGAEVTIKVDALGGRKFSGKVTQVGGATGSRLSLFPPENATGNYVKVVQRIPVRIDFTDLKDEDSDLVLRPGYSVTPIVKVK